jgi:hypothetical protein
LLSRAIRNSGKFKTNPGDNQNVHDNHVQETLKESGSATVLLIDPSDEGIRQAEIPAFVRVADHTTRALPDATSVPRA